MQPFLFDFGLLKNPLDEIDLIDSEILSFKKSNKESVFIWFLGAVNHWVTLAVHKEAGRNSCAFYLMDSSNSEYLDKNDE